MISRFSKTVRHGFSLPELLVAMAVAGVLLAILLPAYQAVRGAGAKAQCVNNFRRLYVAMMAFTEDYEGRLPPTLGPATSVHPAYIYNQYWWGQAYLGRYAIGPLDRRRDGPGRFTQEEVEVYNCPARLAEKPDTLQSNGSPSISYLMAALYPKDPGVVSNTRSIFRLIENKSRTLLLTEGRGMSLYQVNTVTRPFGDSATGLRRFHQGGLNLLFLDGHVETFSGPDADIVKLHAQ